MQTQILFLLGASYALATDAPVTTGNSPTIGFKATLPKSNTTSIRGSVYGHAKSNGKGIYFSVKLTGLPADGSPYLYHIHEYKVGAHQDCNATGAHLDPYGVGEVPACNASKPQTCQVGDLSGKHGRPMAGSYSKTYTDLYISSIAGSAAFFGNRSIVVHDKNKIRLTCANFVVDDPKNVTSSTTTKTKTSTATSVTTIAPTTAAQTTITSASTTAATTSAIATGGASVKGLSAAALMLGGVALLL